jgi:hypothetical protein
VWADVVTIWHENASKPPAPGVSMPSTNRACMP